MTEETIFAAAREKSPAERAAFLDQACAGDAALRARVEVLLAAHESAGSFLEGPAVGSEVTGAFTDGPSRPAEGVGTVVGAYKLLQRIGEGGMGSVWMAEQREPVRRKVALKVIKAGLGSDRVVARFEAERQALALMDHPNIAKVLDAGTTEQGRPFFVMELVKGVPITEYCDEHRLTPRERLDLFVPVCQAVQHAHQKGVIHRDLKPSNILVGLYDGRPVPKVIDFGVAKATGPRLTERTLFTEFGQVVGTLEYMSPEQAELDNLDIDTRSDVYSLGVLLYELLTGTTPLQRKHLEAVALLEVLRLIREEEPPRPSTRLSTTVELPSIAANRGLEPKKLSGLVRGELDWIVMKALEKDRGRRYESANGLATDLLRYLADEPVLACPPSARYRLRKFVRRNKRALATAVVVGAALLAGVGAVAGSVGWAARDRAARRAKSLDGMHQALDRAEWSQENGKWAEALAAAERAEALAGEVGEDPPARLAAVKERLAAQALDQEFVTRFEAIRLEVQSGIREDLYAYTSAAAVPELKELFERFGITVGITPAAAAVARIRSRPADVRVALVAALHECVSIWPEGEPALSWLREVLKAADSDPWRTRVWEAARAGDVRAAEDLVRDADVRTQPPNFVLWITRVRTLKAIDPAVQIALCRRLQHAYPGDFWANHGLAQMLRQQGRPAEAVQYFTAALALRPQNSGVYVNRALAYREAGDLDAALADLRQAIAYAPRDAVAQSGLGSVLRAKGDLDGALAAHRRAVEFGPKGAKFFNNFGLALADAGDRDGAMAAYRQAIVLDPEEASPHVNLGNLLRDKGDADGAIAEYRRAAALDPRHLSARVNLANLLWDRGDTEGAIAAYREAVAADPKSAAAYLKLGVALRKAGRTDDALAAYRRAAELEPGNAHAHTNVGNALDDRGDREGAIAAYHRAVVADPQFVGAHYNLGGVLQKKGDLDGAVAAYRRAIAVDAKDVSAHLNLGVALTAKGDADGAIAAYRAAVAADPRQARPHYALGLTLKRKGDLPAAIAEYRLAIAADPRDDDAHYALGVALEATGDKDGATAAYRQALAINPRHAPAHFNLGNRLREKGDQAGAIASFRQTIVANPGHIMAHYNLGNTLRQQGDAPGAIAAYRRAIAVTPKNASAHYNLGVTLSEQGDGNGAIAAFRATVSADPGHDRAANKLGLALSTKGDLEGAEAAYRDAIRAKPTNGVGHVGLGNVLARWGQWARAGDAYARGVRLGPADSAGWYGRGTLLLQAGDRDGHRQTCRGMLEQFAATTNPVDAARTARLCLLAPDAVADLGPVTKLVERATEKEGQAAGRNELLLQALAEFRAGRPGGAAERLRRVEPKAQGSARDALAFALLALAGHGDGRADDARAALAAARALLAERQPDPAVGRPFAGDWSDWLQARALVREAEGLIEKK